MRLFRVAAFLALAVGLTGCAQQQAVQYPPFPAQEYAKLKRTGTAAVTGQAFLRTKGGDVKVGAGSEILLIPATSYSRVFYNAYKARQPLGPTDPAVKQYTLRTQADATGAFEFKAVPEGSYFLAGDVVWQAPTQFGLARQGGMIVKEISVRDGDQLKVMLTE